jgi:VanZ family protein
MLMRKILKNWGPVLAYFALIFIFSSVPVQVKPGVDKLLHVVEYAVMGFFTARAVLLTWDLPRNWGLLLGAALAALLGLLDEVHQYFVPGRSASVYDGAADLVGAILGALLFLTVGALLYQSHKLYPDAHDKCC